MSQADDNMHRLVRAREQFDELMARPLDAGEEDISWQMAARLSELGRTLGVSEDELVERFGRFGGHDILAAAGYEPPKVQLVGNMHELLAHVCPPKVAE